MTVQEVCLRMIGVLQQLGWCKHQLEDDNGCVCILGARNVVIFGEAEKEAGTGNRTHSQIAEDVRIHITQYIRDRYVGYRNRSTCVVVSEWNDAGNRTLEEVLDLLEECSSHD